MTLFPLAATPFALPLAARFRGLDLREGVLFEGPEGWGEFAPFADYGPEQDARWLVAAIEMAVSPTEASDVEVRVNAIVPEVPDAELAAAVRALVSVTGCRVAKLKVGGRPVSADIVRVTVAAAAADDLVPGFRWRLDGNGLLRPEQAAELAAAVRAAGVLVEYFEQPCRTVPELTALRSMDPQVPIAVDEIIRRDRDFPAVADIADVAVVKVAPLGGVRQVRRLIEELPVPVVISGAAESSVGLARDVRVAAEVADPHLVHGLGTGTLLADDLVTDPLIPTLGALTARHVTVSPEAVARAADRLDAEGRARWRARLDQAWRVALERDFVHRDDRAALGVSG